MKPNTVQKAPGGPGLPRAITSAMPRSFTAALSVSASRLAPVTSWRPHQGMWVTARWRCAERQGLVKASLPWNFDVRRGQTRNSCHCPPPSWPPHLPLKTDRAGTEQFGNALPNRPRRPSSKKGPRQSRVGGRFAGAWELLGSSRSVNSVPGELVSWAMRESDPPCVRRPCWDGCRPRVRMSERKCLLTQVCRSTGMAATTKLKTVDRRGATWLPAPRTAAWTPHPTPGRSR